MVLPIKFSLFVMWTNAATVMYVLLQICSYLEDTYCNEAVHLLTNCVLTNNISSFVMRADVVTVMHILFKIMKKDVLVWIKFCIDKRACVQQNTQVGMCAHLRLRSDCASGQSDQSL